jgi:HAD superfamily hydrolase (TIGR01509 family)
VLAAVVFDLDGVIVDTEEAWDQARREFVAATGGRWKPEATAAMMGMSSVEWSAYMRAELGVELSPEEISDGVVETLAGELRERLPLIDGAVEAVEAVARRWPLALASSANRPIIELVLELAGIAERFRVVVSSEEVARGKPAPDVYLEAVRRLGFEPGECAAVEDSSNGLRAAIAAGLRVVAFPNRAFPPAPEVLGEAAARISGLDELADALDALAAS